MAEEKMLITGKKIVAEYNNSQIRGKALGVDGKGGLIIEADSGERITLCSGMVFLNE